jgi:ribosomal protein S18 acetylase RimI-like enzyme
MSESSVDTLAVRPLKSSDFDGVVELDSKLLGGENRHDYWEKKFAVFRMRHPNLSLVAVIENRVVGCVMGNISGWEFGVSAGIGWVELIGVDQEYRRKGIADALIDELLKQFNKLNVKKVYTMFDTSDAGSRDFFHSAGFKVGKMVQLEIDLD